MMCSYLSPIFRFVANSPHVAQATQIDMLLTSVANGQNRSSGFCAGSHIVVDHQRIHGGSVAQGVRTRGRRHQGHRHEGAGEAEMCTLAASGALLVRYVCVRLSYSSPYLMPAPVDHIYHNISNRG